MIWKVRTTELDLTSRALLMGILNVTLDSFSDGGKFAEPLDAVKHALEMAEAGAAIIDIGGESTRPGAEPVSVEVELERVLPVIRALAGKTACLLSIDTCKPEVARAAVAAGADIVNDINGLRDPAMVEVVRDTGAGAVVMHMQGTPRTMQQNPVYDDVVAEVGEFFRQCLERLVASGVNPMCLVFDPGIGFGKKVEHNLSLLRHLRALGENVRDRPLLLGVSLKSFIGRVIGSDEMADREWPTVALSSYAREQGVRVLRVHDVLPNFHAVRMTEAILGVPVDAKCATLSRK